METSTSICQNLQTMKIIILLAFFALTLRSQTIYQNGKPVATYSHPYIYKGSSKFSTDIIGSLKDSRIYTSQFTYSTNASLTIKLPYIYKGLYPTQSSLLYTIKGNYIYSKGATTPTYTYINNKLYKGSFIHPAYIIANTNKELPIYVIVYLLN